VQRLLATALQAAAQAWRAGARVRCRQSGESEPKLHAQTPFLLPSRAAAADRYWQRRRAYIAACRLLTRELRAELRRSRSMSEIASFGACSSCLFFVQFTRAADRGTTQRKTRHAWCVTKKETKSKQKQVQRTKKGNEEE
jgi:hypothetical protein